MVRIDRIVMQGFKSFAGKVSIPFPDNFTVIVGPNGAGKSNIIDGLNFVIGISRASAIRAKKLENLVFNGSPTKSPAEWCEVSLYIDNKDKKIPDESDEVKISRKITRSGISTYKINSKTMNRSKVIETLSYANISPDGHNIIMQGDVTRVIEMMPMERREVIEDISGISEFDDKKDKAQKELEKVDSRLKEVSIIIAEKVRLVERLKREKENAEKYIKLESEMKKARASLLKKTSEVMEKELDGLKEKIKQRETEFHEKDKIFGEKSMDIDNTEKEIESLTRKIIEKSQNLEIMKKINSINNEILRKHDQIEMNERDIQRVETVISFQDDAEGPVREILKLHDSGVYGTINNLIRVPRQYSIAIEVALGRHKNDIVVDKADTAIRCIKYLKGKKIGTARFIPMDKIKSHKIEKADGTIGIAVDMIEFERKYTGAINYVLGSTAVAEDIDKTKMLEDMRIVTLDGDMVEKSGAMIGGFYRRKKTVELEKEVDVKSLEEKNIQLSEEIKKLETEITVLSKQQTEETQEFKMLQKRKEECETKLGTLRKTNRESFDQRAKLQNDVSSLKIEKAKLEAKYENIKLDMEEISEVKEFFTSLSSDELKEKIRTCSVEITQLGPINMAAISEYAVIGNEYEVLRDKMNKLISEKEAVENTVTEIEKRKYDKLMNTLNEVSKNFNKIYYDMAGGRGDIRLEEDGNIESGLVIEANPKGKTVLNIDSMSGGEKVLTSLAFIFAVQQHNPSPFYVLDEIEAALDKVNTQKIVNMIKKYSSDIQFIVITHNDITTSSADKVFGISMEQGTSRVFGIDMSETQEKTVE